MKKSISKKSQTDTIDSNTFLSTVIPNIKINRNSYPLGGFQKNKSKAEKPSANLTSVKPN